MGGLFKDEGSSELNPVIISNINAASSTYLVIGPFCDKKLCVELGLGTLPCVGFIPKIPL